MLLLNVDTPIGRILLEKSEVDFRLMNNRMSTLIIIVEFVVILCYVYISDSQMCSGCGIEKTKKRFIHPAFNQKSINRAYLHKILQNVIFLASYER